MAVSPNLSPKRVQDQLAGTTCADAKRLADLFVSCSVAAHPQGCSGAFRRHKRINRLAVPSFNDEVADRLRCDEPSAGSATALGGRVLFGSLILAAGVFIARFLSGLMSSSGEGAFGQTLMRYGIIALATAIGLRFMGLANEIVILPFGLILRSAAVASALAFGLGGRRPVERVLDEYASRALTKGGGRSAFSFGESDQKSPEENNAATRV